MIDLQKSDFEIFPMKGVSAKQTTVPDREFNSTSINNLCLFLKNYENLQEYQKPVCKRSSEIRRRDIDNKRCSCETNKCP